MLQRVGSILNDHVEDIVRDWVTDLRQTPETSVHNDLLSAQIVDGKKTLLANVAATVTVAVAPDAESARAAATAEVISHRARLDEPRQSLPAGATTVPEPVILLPSGAAETPESLGGPLPAPQRRPLYRACVPAAPAPAADTPAMRGDTFRQALAVAEHEGQLRQSQGYHINEVVQEHIVLRRQMWKTLMANMRRSDQPAMELAIYLEAVLDSLLTSSLQAYQQAALAELEKRAVRDPLTGLYNHRYCWERIHEELRRAQRQTNEMSLIMFDLDYLKRINDTYGHQEGDRVLKYVAAGMGQVARESDVLCRYAGDEFALILPGIDRAQAAIAAERLRSVLHAPLLLHPAGRARPEHEGGRAAEVVITISAGVAAYPADARTAEALIAQADAALYRAKAAGRDRVA